MVRYSSDISVIDVHGEMFRAGVATETTIANVNEWTQVLDFGAGALDNVLFASNALTASVSGDYDVDWAASASSVSTLRTFEFAIFVDLVLQTKVQSRRRFANADVGVMAGSGIVHINGGQVVTFRTRNIVDSTNIIFNFCNVNIHRI